MNELESKYLEHHGILGQKWHKRNGPPYPLDAGDHSKSEQNAGYKKSLGGGRNEELYDRKARKKGAKQATRDLNENDQERSENIYKFNQAKKRYEKYEKKAMKAKEGSKKREKYVGKSLDAYLDSEEAREAIDKGNERAKEILGYLEENGYNVKMKDTIRTVNRGENAVKSMLTSGLVTAALTVAGGPAGIGAAAVVTQNRVKGTKFKVKDKTDKQRARDAKQADIDNSRNANEILRYSGSKYKKDASKYISKLSDDKIRKEADDWRKYSEEFKNKGDSETAKEYAENAAYYERELKKRQGSK